MIFPFILNGYLNIVLFSDICLDIGCLFYLVYLCKGDNTIRSPCLFIRKECLSYGSSFSGDAFCMLLYS